MEFISVRLIERILVAVVGGLSLSFGYRLLQDKQNKKEHGEGQIRLPGGIAIDVRRVGAGVFFALFGSLVVAFAIYSSVSISVDTRTLPDGEEQESVSMTGVGEATAFNDDTQRTRVTQDIEFLNETMPEILSAELSESDQAFADLDMQHLKLTLIRSIWDGAWGDFNEFETLAESNNLGSAPATMQVAVDYFRTGSE